MFLSWLLTLGAYGRISGHLPPDSPYAHPRPGDDEDLDLDLRLESTVVPPPGVTRSIPHLQAGVRTVSEMEQAFARGAEWIGLFRTDLKLAMDYDLLLRLHRLRRPR